MKSTSAPLLALMRGNQEFTLADFYTITLATGSMFRYTDFDVDLVFGGNTFSASGPAFKRGKTRIVIGLEVDTLDVEIYPRSTDLLNGIPMLAAAVNGGFDGASLELERAYIYPGTTVVGTIDMFVGQFADLEVSRGGIKLRVNSDVADLNVNLPRNVYQAACCHTLYDADCAVNRSTYGVSGTAATCPDASTIYNFMGQPPSYFDRGYLQFTSGALAGIKRTVKSYWPGTITIFYPLPSIPAYGDAFTIYPGCDKNLSTCQARFNNAARFKGFPFIPAPETVI